MLPITATPSAPPVCRVVSLTAEPTPALPGGNEPMIDSVAGAAVNPMPAPNNSRTRIPQPTNDMRSEEHTSELQSRLHLVCRLLLEKKNMHTQLRPLLPQ